MGFERTAVCGCASRKRLLHPPSRIPCPRIDDKAYGNPESSKVMRLSRAAIWVNWGRTMHFISHSSLDKAAALGLRDRLLARGYDAQQIFLDSDEDSGIAAGRKWEQVLYERLKDCRALIVLCTPHWQQSKWCFAELIYAKMAGKEVFPVVLADCDLSVASDHQAVFVNREGEAAYARLLDTLAARRLGPKDHLPWPHPDLRDVHGQPDDCPFPGLPAFDERYAAVYFGRERETHVVLEALRQMRSKGEPRLLMIVGGSGSGKSSLLMAGVLPRLKHTTSRSDWLVLPTLRFGRRDYPDALFESLADEIVARYPPDAAAKGIIPDRKTLRDQFASDDAAQAAKAFLDAARDLTFACGLKDATVLLPFDQFEEFLPPSGGANGMKFLKFLEQACQHRNDRLLVIGTMRSDYLDVYERQPHALKAPTFHPWRLEPFPREQIENVIVKPAARIHVEITPELLEQLKQETPTTDALPLLAFTLEKLYRAYAGDKKLDLSEYKSLGGMEGSIKHAAEQIMPANSLPPNVESAVRLSFVKHLAQVNEKDEFVRLIARWNDLDPAAYPILEQFVTQRLLIKSERDGEVTLEVAHEAIFRSWEQLKTWLRTSADILRWRRDVRRSQESDKANGKKWSGLTRSQLEMARGWPKRRRNELSDDEVKWINRGIHFEWFVYGTVAAIILIIASLGAMARYQRSVAIEQTGIAKTETKKAQKSDAETKNANQRNLAQLHIASMADLASGKKAWQEDYDARQKGRRAETDGRKSKWHEAIAYFARALKHEPANQRAAFWFHSTLLNSGNEKYDLPLHSLPHANLVHRASFSPDGTKVVTASGGFGSPGYAQVWNVATGRELGDRLSHDNWVTRASFSPDGTKVLTASGYVPDDGYSQVWEVPSDRRLGKPHPHKGRISSACFSPDGLRVVTVNNDRYSYYVEVWDVKTGDPVGEPMPHKGVIDSVTFSPDGTMVVTASWDKTARILDVATGQSLGEPLRHEAQVRSASFSPDRSMVGTKSDGEILRVWEVATNQDLTEVSPAVLDWAEAIAGLRFGDDGALQVIPDDERRKVLDAPDLPPGLWADLAAWLKTRGPERTISPRSKVTLRQIAERERDFLPSSRESLESALRYDPTVPLARMMLANVLEKEELAKEAGQRDAAVLARAAHWRRYDLDRLPDDPQLWSRAAEILRDAPSGAMVGVGPQPITAASAADECDRRAKLP